MIKVKQIPNDEITLTPMRYIEDAQIFEAAFKKRIDNLSLKILFPFIESENKKYERFNFLYKNIASAFCEFCKENSKNAKDLLYGNLSFKFTCFDSRFVSLYIESATNVKSELGVKRLGQIFEFDTMMLTNAQKIAKNKKIRKKDIITSLSNEYAKRNREYDTYFFHKVIKKHFNMSNSYMTSNGFRFFFDSKIFSNDGLGFTVLPFLLQDAK